MKIGYLGAGAWGFSLANVLAENGHDITLWVGKDTKFVDVLKAGKPHPKLKEFKLDPRIKITADLKEAIDGAEALVESVTSQGVRPVLEQILAYGPLKVPFISTSKGIEQNTGLLLSEVALEVLGPDAKDLIGCISGPSLAYEVMKKLPTSVVCSSYNPKLMYTIMDMFSRPYFRIYPNKDMPGVSFGGAMKNIIAIASGLADGLGFGENTKAALMTRGLHEIRKLSTTKGCQPETLNGLSGLGDLCVTCLSTKSRNYIFGKLLAEGLSPDEARTKIGMVVEGSFTCLSALQLSRKHGIPVPITEVVHSIIYEGMDPRDAVLSLLTREVKAEHL